jgi:hypothetical protein
VVLEACDCIAQAGEKTPPKAFCMTEQEKQPAFENLEAGLSKKRNGKTIFARVQVNGKWTWRSTKTGDLELAKKWKEKWDRKRWLEKQGFVAKESSSESRTASKNENGHGSQEVDDPESSSLIINEILDNYVAAGHPTIKKRKLKSKSPRSIRNEQYSGCTAQFGGELVMKAA